MWQPIETAPKHGLALFALPERRGFLSEMQVGYWSDREGGHWVVMQEDYYEAPISPTHWMPLPEPPNSAPHAPEQPS